MQCNLKGGVEGGDGYVFTISRTEVGLGLHVFERSDRRVMYI